MNKIVLLSLSVLRNRTVEQFQFGSKSKKEDPFFSDPQKVKSRIHKIDPESHPRKVGYGSAQNS
jgi:hypothetical protein